MPAAKLFFQHQEKSFIRLDALINFTEIDMIRPDSYTPEQLANFLQYFDFEKELIELTQQQYHAEVDESLEDDIYKQNPKRTRSITELTSNAIDAEANQIKVLIEDKHYSVRDQGYGMTPEVIFRKFLPPKSTSKEEAQSKIGQFGLGFYTCLAHLITEQDAVIVTTKAENHLGYRIEFRKIDGKICVHIAPDENIQDLGTEIHVYSEQVTLDEFHAALVENIRFHYRTPIFINDVLINPFHQIRSRNVSKTQVIIDEHIMPKAAIITLGGITIQTVPAREGTNTLTAVWDLPRHLFTISESRNQIRLASPEASHEIKRLIDAADDLSGALQLSYLNTIAPLILNLQEHNASQKVQHNVFYYLQTKIKTLYAHQKQLPDLPLLKPLISDDVVVLHPILVNPDWQKKLCIKPREWNSDKATLLLVPMHDAEVKLIIDEETHTIYMNRAYYQTAKKEKSLYKLELLFSLSPEKIKSNWHSFMDTDSVEEHRPWLQPDNPETHPHFNLYRKHGILSEYGEGRMNQLSQETYHTLQGAETLMQVYPATKVKTQLYHNELELYNFKEVIPYFYRGVRYYLAEADTSFNRYGRHVHIFLNQAFQQLFQFHYLLLQEKARQLREAGIVGCEITLSAEDRLLIRNEAYGVCGVYDGTGACLLKQELDELPILTILNKDYYLLHEHKSYHISTLLYNKNNQLMKQLNGRYQLLQSEPLILGVKRHNYEGSWEAFYLVETGQLIQFNSEHSRLEYNPKSHLFTNYQYERIWESYKGFSLISAQGTELFSYSVKDSYRERIQFVSHHIQGDELYVSILKSGTKELLICRKKADDTYELSTVINGEGFIGFPAQAYWSHQPPSFTNKLIAWWTRGYLGSTENTTQLNFIETTNIPIRNITSQQTYKRKSSGLFRDPDVKRIKSLRPAELHLASYRTGFTRNKIILDEENIIPLPRSLYGVSIENIVSYCEYYLITDSDNTQYLCDAQGNVITSAQDITLYKTQNYDFFLLNNNCVVNRQNEVIYSNEHLNYIKPIHSSNQLHISLKSPQGDYSDDLIDHQGNSLIGGPQTNVMEWHSGLITYKTHTDQHVSRTSLAQFHNVRLSLNENHYGNQELYSTSTLDNKPVYIYNAMGYSLFAMPLSHPLYVGPSIISGDDEYSSSKYLLTPLSLDVLTKEQVQSNLRFLNQFPLNAIQFGLCLRFIELDSVDFQMLYPAMQRLHALPEKEQVPHLTKFITAIKEEPEEHQNLLIDLLSLVYRIGGSYSPNNMAEKIYRLFKVFGIYNLKNFYDELAAQRMLITAPTAITTQRHLMDELSQKTGQYVYYIFSDLDNLFMPEPMLLQTQTIQGDLSLADFATAFRLDTRIIERSHNKSEFVQRVQALTAQADTHHARRKLVHAIYHQAHPEKCLYLREFIQNAIDAYAETKDGMNHMISIRLSKNAANRCVLTLQDNGGGMNMEHIFKFVLVPGNSSKRNAIKGLFIGGRGVGLFTALPDAEELLIKTGCGENQTHYVSLKPIYELDPYGQRKIIDVALSWETTSESFKGTVIQRVSLEDDPELEAAKYHRAVSTHAKFINDREFTVVLNTSKVNQTLLPLIELNIPNIGLVKIYKSNEGAITAGGLYIKAYNKEILAELPYFIRQIFEKYQLVIELPKDVPLNRERNDFENTEYFSNLLRKNLIQGFYAAYFNLFMRGYAQTNELPYDFFNRFKLNHTQMLMRNPQVAQDAAKINQGGTLDDYRIYQDPQLLTDLMCFLELIEYKTPRDSVGRKLSIVQMAAMYKAGTLDKRCCPLQIQNQIDFDEECFNHRREFMKVTDSIAEFRDVTWRCNNFTDAKHMELFILLCQKIIPAFTSNPIDFYFSTIAGDALAYTQNGSNDIYWNPVAVLGEFKILFEGYFSRAVTPYIFEKALSSLIKTLTHELVHLSESECSGTHNHAFYIRQRELLIKGLPQIPTQELYDFYEDFFNTHLNEKTMPNAVEFIRAQLTPSLSYIQSLRDAQRAAIAREGFFADNSNSDIEEDNNEEYCNRASPVD